MDTRAWCFQEDVLPKRRLIYRGDEMEWRCSHHHICECGHVGIRSESTRHQPMSLDKLDDTSSTSTSVSKPRLDTVRGDKLDHLERWRSLVRQYSPRLLTMPEDKLMAIAGVAKLLAQKSSNGTDGACDAYHAGLWGSELLQQLLWWSADKDISPTPKHFQMHNGVPSWSWASIQGPVAYMNPPLNSHRMVKRPSALVKEIHLGLVFQNIPTGPVDGGHIILEAQMAPMELTVVLEPDGTPETLIRSKSTTARASDASPWLHDIGLDITWPVAVMYDEDDERIKCWEGDNSCVGEGCVCESIAMEGEFFCCRLLDWVDNGDLGRELPGLLRRETVNAWKTNPETEFLLLEKMMGQDIYRRVGAGRSHATHTSGEVTDWVTEWAIFRESTRRTVKII
ncbi:hypothetical protein B0H63DRAFT_77877 [Podospora didyma]|uniref:Uncharacterized protein n=1 Tax=Podospora didyma TaxID=330526 RepID=A0AAE0N2Q6_9PEZI|nr:hypothetical protein B0H63DRAFT_77877 [Podospora didyma]